MHMHRVENLSKGPEAGRTEEGIDTGRRTRVHYATEENKGHICFIHDIHFLV